MHSEVRCEAVPPPAPVVEPTGAAPLQAPVAAPTAASIAMPFYRPLSRERWTWQGALDEAAPVVVVAALFAREKDPRLYGNGVVVEGGDRGKARVLTCAHLVRQKGVETREVRVGLFRHSYRVAPAGAPDYQELEARVLAYDDARDLALLELEAPASLASARVTKASGEFRGYDFISVVPFGQPRKCRANFHPRFVRGQSGSPDLKEGFIFGLAQGVLARRLDVIVSPETISAFLAKHGL